VKNISVYKISKGGLKTKERCQYGKSIKSHHPKASSTAQDFTKWNCVCSLGHWRLCVFILTCMMR